MPDLGAVLWFLFGIGYFSQAKIWGLRIRQRGRTEFSLTLLGPSSPSWAFVSLSALPSDLFVPMNPTSPLPYSVMQTQPCRTALSRSFSMKRDRVWITEQVHLTSPLGSFSIGKTSFLERKTWVMNQSSPELTHLSSLEPKTNNGFSLHRIGEQKDSLLSAHAFKSLLPGFDHMRPLKLKSLLIQTVLYTGSDQP